MTVKVLHTPVVNFKCVILFLHHSLFHKLFPFFRVQDRFATYKTPFSVSRASSLSKTNYPHIQDTRYITYIYCTIQSCTSFFSYSSCVAYHFYRPKWLMSRRAVKPFICIFYFSMITCSYSFSKTFSLLGEDTSSCSRKFK